MRAEFIQLEIAAGSNTNKLIRRDGPSRRRKVDIELMYILLKAQTAGLQINFKAL